MAEWKAEDIRGIINTEGKLLFPIHWLNDQHFCEYKLFLERVRGIEVEPTREMVEGREEHERLYSEFERVAVPSTLTEMLEESKVMAVSSREFRVISQRYRVYGKIDEARFYPDEFVIVDDKPGTKKYDSDIHQVYGYYLAFKETIEPSDRRPIIAALRERGTDNIYWRVPFDENAEGKIISVINRVHRLISGQVEFTSNKNPNKCRACRFRPDCDRSVV